MARPKSQFRNEIKSSVTDSVFQALSDISEARGISMSRAVNDVLSVGLFGMAGSIGYLPPHSQPYQSGIRTETGFSLDMPTIH